MIDKTAVVIVNWNSWDQLGNCIMSLERQTVPFGRIVVVDNASEQQGDVIIAKWAKRIEFIQSPTNHGFAKGNNIALETMKECDFVALVNPDAYLEPDWLQGMLAAAERYPDTASFASCLVMANSPEIWDGYGDSYHMSGLVWRSGHGRVRNTHLVNEQDVFSACAAAALYRFESLQTIGGFDEDFFCYVEDVDLGFRLRLAGYRCILVPDAIAYHVGSATTGGKHSDFAVYHGHRNLVWTFLKNMPGYLFWMLLPLHLIMNLVSILVFIVRGQGGVIVRSKWDALKGIKLMWHKRKQVQAGRAVPVEDIWRALDKRLILFK